MNFWATVPRNVCGVLRRQSGSRQNFKPYTVTDESGIHALALVNGEVPILPSHSLLPQRIDSDHSQSGNLDRNFFGCVHVQIG
jgi:hypothetical protein